MKSRLFLSLLMGMVALIGFTALPTTAEAGGSNHRSLSHNCGSCGGSIYKKRVISRRDRCGRPVYRWVRISHRCAPKPPPPVVHHGGCSHGRGCNSCDDGPGAGRVILGILGFIAEQSRNSPSSSSRYNSPSPPSPSRHDDGYRY